MQETDTYHNCSQKVRGTSKMCITSDREEEIPLISYQEDKGIGK